MNSTRVLLWGAICGVVVLAASPARAGSNEVCAFGDTWTEHDYVPVYLHQDVAPSLLHSTDPNSTWTLGELEGEIRWALDRVADSYADIPRFYYGGVSNCPTNENCDYPGAVHIQVPPVPTNQDDANKCSGTGAWVPGNGTVATGKSIFINRSALSGFGTACSIFWIHWSTQHYIPAASTGTMTGTLVHEMMHVLGLDHIRACSVAVCNDNSGTCSVAEVGVLETREAHSWYLYDVRAIQYLYGEATSHSSSKEHYESGGFPNWGSLEPWSAVPEIQRGADATVSQDDWMYVATVDSSYLQPVVYGWDWWPISWSTAGSSVSENVLHRVGAAYDGTDVYSHYLVGESEVWVSKVPAELRLPSDVNFANILTRRHGVESAVDGISDPLRILTYRANGGQIQLQIVDDDPTPTFRPPVTVVDSLDNPIIAYETPSVACADDFGALNCILVWATAAEAGTPGDPHLHVLAWVQFQPLLTGDFVFGDVFYSPYVLEGPPRVTHRRNQSGSPAEFVVAYPQSNGAITQLVTLSKSTSPTDPSWAVSGLHDYHYAAKGFALGSSLWNTELVIRRW